MPAASPPPSAPAFPEETLPTKVADVPGTWDLSRDGTTRRCVMTLLRDRGPAGQKVNFPAGCRRALPLMGAVAGWLYSDEAVRLVDANVRPVLLFPADQFHLLFFIQPVIKRDKTDIRTQFYCRLIHPLPEITVIVIPDIFNDNGYLADLLLRFPDDQIRGTHQKQHHQKYHI